MGRSASRCPCSRPVLPGSKGAASETGFGAHTLHVVSVGKGSIRTTEIVSCSNQTRSVRELSMSA